MAGIAALSLWLILGTQTAGLGQRLPGADKVVVAPPPPRPPLDIRKLGKLVTLDGTPGKLGGAWPRFRGAHFDNVSRETVPLARSWPETGPPKLWEIDVGEGYAGAAVLNGRAYVLDYDKKSRADVLRCLSVDTGEDIWQFSYPVQIKRNHGMSRTVPAVTAKHVVALGPKCHVICLDAVTGQLGWSIDLVVEYGTTVPDWYAGQCPLIDGGRAILAPGGPDVLMMAVDCASGKVLWKTPNRLGWQMTHSSIIPMTLAGQRMYVYCATGGVVGVSADDGRLLWKFPDWQIRIANVASPVSVGNDRIFLAGGYRVGALMLEVTRQGQTFTANGLFKVSHEVFGAEQQTPVLYNGHIYGVREKSADGRLVCVDLDGNLAWPEGSTDRFGLGPFLIADGLIFVMDDHGLLTLAEATPTGYRRLAQAKVLHGKESWGAMALAGGKLILRDLKKMICLDVKAP